MPDPTPAQLARRGRFAAEESVDVHCHCLPGLDDGPATMTDAVAMCRLLAADGITTVIATPHQLGTYEGANPPAAVRAAVADLSAALAAAAVPLRVVPGGDVRVDDGLLDHLSADRVLTLADGHAFLLLELPHESLVDLTRIVAGLTAAGVTPVLSHPERHDVLARRVDVALPWVAGGLLMQVTAGSLVGQFGPAAERAGWQMVERGLVALVATDAHDTARRPPSMSAAVDAIAARLGPRRRPPAVRREPAANPPRRPHRPGRRPPTRGCRATPPSAVLGVVLVTPTDRKRTTATAGGPVGPRQPSSAARGSPGRPAREVNAFPSHVQHPAKPAAARQRRFRA